MFFMQKCIMNEVLFYKLKEKKQKLRSNIKKV